MRNDTKFSAVNKGDPSISMTAVNSPVQEELFTEEQKKTHIYQVTKYMAYHPISSCSCMTCFIFLVVIAAAFGGALTMSVPSQYDWIIASTTESKNNDALSYSIDNVDQIAAGGELSQTSPNNWFFVFDAKNNEDIYTADNLLQMCKVESLIAKSDDYPNFCLMGDNDECSLPATSIVVYFYDFANVSSWDCTLLNSSVVDQKKSVIYDGLSTPEGREQYGQWLSTDAVAAGYTTKVNSMWYFGAPLVGYNSSFDRVDEQEKEYQSFFTALDGKVGGIEEDLFKRFNMDTNEDSMLPYYPSPYMSPASTSALEVKWFNGLVNNNETNRLVSTDLLFAFFSIVFVWIWMRVHTKSTFLASTGMYMVFFSIPFSMAIYKGIYGIPFFSELHTLVIFIVLGVGADDVFVLVDSWRMTAVEFPGEIQGGKNRHIIHARLYQCYEHTVETVFNTSFTTAVAFIATGFSPLMPISTFGWFAATCIVANYVFCITMMAPAVVISALYFEDCGKTVPTAAAPTVATDGHAILTQCENTKQGIEADSPGGLELTTVGSGHSSTSPDNVVNFCGSRDIESSVDTASLVHVDGAADEVVPQKQDLKELALENTPWVDMYIKFISLAVTVDSSGCSVVDESVAICPASAEPAKSNGHAARANEPVGFTRIPLVSLIIAIGLTVFGIVGIVYGVALRPPTGQEQWYPSQHMFSKVTKEMSNSFLGSDDASYAKAMLTFGIAGMDRSGFNKYKPGDNRGTAIYDSNYNLAAPACQRVFVRMCEEVPPRPCTSSACQPTYRLARDNTTECFMTNFRTYMQDGYGVDTYNMSEDHFFSNLTAFRATELQTYHTGQSWQDMIGFTDGVLKYATLSFTTTMDLQAPMTKKQEVLDNVNSFIASVKQYPECQSNQCDCDSLMFSSDFAFAWMRSEEGLLNGFYQGLSIAFPVAFLVLLVATGNIIISFFAILSVFFIVFNVLGFVNYSLGWDLGIAESIAGIIIIGFSVDYTVHIGHMYTHGEHLGLHSREEKFKFASKKMVATIVGGAITTAGAGVFMFACQLMFFVKMATLIVATIVLSYMYALGFFMSMLYLVGPEGKTGNVYHMMNDFLVYLDGEYPVLRDVIPLGIKRRESSIANSPKHEPVDTQEVGVPGVDDGPAEPVNGNSELVSAVHNPDLVEDL